MEHLQAEMDELNSAEMPDQTQLEIKTAQLVKLNESIVGWEGVLKHVQSTLDKAKAGNLSAVNNLMPSELMNNAKKLDLSSAPGAVAELASYDSISFTGGGHAVG